MPVPKNLPVDGRIEIDGVEFDLDKLYPDLRVDPAHIIQQLTDQAAIYGYWSVLSEEADVILFSKKRKLELVEAELDEKLRKEARDEGEKVTETIIQRRILREEEYQDAMDAMVEARRNAAYLGRLVRALEQRLSVLIAVNNRDRAEMAAAGREGS